MTIWVDAQLSPTLAKWLSTTWAVTAVAVRELGLRDADDLVIFNQAKTAGAVLMTKDRDFLDLLDRFGPPPQILWLTCGNTSNASLHGLLSAAMPSALELLSAGEPLVEIGDAPSRQ